MGYTVSGVTLANPIVLSANYYNNYAFLNTNGINDGAYLPEAGFGTPYPASKGLLTGTLTAQFEPGGAISSDYLYSVKYYDNRGRVIQVAEKVTGGTSRLNTNYDFAGNPLLVKERQSVHGLQTDIQTAYNYDHVGRRLSEKVSVNGIEQAAIAYTHDEVGRLASQKYVKGTWSTTETMGYNIRSWLTEKASPYFSMQLRYNNVLLPASKKNYGGGISEWTWQHTGGPNNMYSLQYDDADRLTGAQQYVASGSNWASATSHYSENGISYDKNGNILTLQRSAGGIMVDNLSYSYDGNRLSALTESVASPGAADILIQRSSPQGTYNYNANGNMVYDSRKNLTYGYNILNLTDMVKQGQTVKATYKWSANGAKLSVRDGAGTNGFDYAGSVVYARNSSGTNVDAIHFDHGVIRKQADGYMVNYFLNDHLGSTRVVLDGNGLSLVENLYLEARDNIASGISTAISWGKSLFSDSPMQEGKMTYSNGKASMTMTNVPAGGKLAAMANAGLNVLGSMPGGGPAAGIFIKAPGVKNAIADVAKSVLQTEKSLLKSEKSFVNLISEHKQKLQQYLKNPDKFDNKGLLEGKSNEMRAKIISGRVKALQGQISKQENELKKIRIELNKLRDGE
ncbi:RHS repeat domain-containing protein [Arcticibacter tournemirensis]